MHHKNHSNNTGITQFKTLIQQKSTLMIINVLSEMKLIAYILNLLWDFSNIVEYLCDNNLKK